MSSPMELDRASGIVSQGIMGRMPSIECPSSSSEEEDNVMDVDAASHGDVNTDTKLPDTEIVDELPEVLQFLEFREEEPLGLSQVKGISVECVHKDYRGSDRPTVIGRWKPTYRCDTQILFMNLHNWERELYLRNGGTPRN